LLTPQLLVKMEKNDETGSVERAEFFFFFKEAIVLSYIKFILPYTENTPF